MTTKVLITGMSGLIGGAVQRRLAGRYELTALNRREVAGVPTVQADISDLEAIRPAFAGQDVVVHLAAVLGDRAGWEAINRVNIDGTYNVLEAARQAGVKRVIFASSGTVVAGWEQDEPYASLVTGAYDRVQAPWPMLTHTTPARPRGLYGASKAAGEALARSFADGGEMSVICLRIGRVVAEDRPLNDRDYSIWCSQSGRGLRSGPMTRGRFSAMGQNSFTILRSVLRAVAVCSGLRLNSSSLPSSNPCCEKSGYFFAV